MPKSSKRASAQKATASAFSNPPKEAKPIEIGAEFSQIPASLEPFVEALSRDYVYLLHLDAQPRAVKRQIFMFPVFLNLLIAVVVACRIYSGIYEYPDLILLLLGRDSPAYIDTSTASWTLIGKTIARRTFTFLVDYLLATLFLPWPIRFCAGPLRWRLKLGFQNVEVVVRKSREWTQGLAEDPRKWLRSNRALVNERILPALAAERLRNKTGFLMIDADWDLDFSAMINAHQIIDARSAGGKKRREDFELFLPSVLVYGGESSGWLIWRVEEAAGNNDTATPESELSPSQRKILSFQNKLTEMGKEDLFFRWVELVQFESTQPGGFTPERQRKAMADVKELFEKEGVDFEKFWADVGGMEGLSL
jgi:hypothetical protein